jgi:F0F1-type ATP synthase assembly protein I
LTASTQRVTRRPPVPTTAPEEGRLADQQPAKPAKTKAERNFDALSMSSIGLEMGAAVAIGLLVGNWLDGRLDSYPYMTLLWLFAGIGAAFKVLWRVNEKAKASRAESNE